MSTHHPYYQTAKQAQREALVQETTAFLRACERQRAQLAGRRILS